MKIAGINLFELSAAWDEPAGRMRVALPFDLYPDQVHPNPPNKRKSELKHIYLALQTDDDVSGLFGPIERRQAFLIATELGPLLRATIPWRRNCCLTSCCGWSGTGVPACS